MYRFKVWDSSRKPRNYNAFVGYDAFGHEEYVSLEVSSYKEALQLKKKLKQSYIAGRGWNVDRPEKYLATLCWPQ